VADRVVFGGSKKMETIADDLEKDFEQSKQKKK